MRIDGHGSERAASTTGCCSAHCSRCATLGTRSGHLGRPPPQSDRWRRAPWPAPERLQNAVAPGLGEFVPIERAAGAGGRGRGERRRCDRLAPAGRRYPASSPGAGVGAAASLLRRTAPSDGRRATSAGGRGAAGARGRIGGCRAGRAAQCGSRGARPGKAGAPDCERSRTLTRSDSASIPESRSGRTARTAAISRTTCASGRLAHVDQCVTQDLHAAHDAGQTHRFGHGAEPLERRTRHRAQLGCQRGEEDLA